MTGDANKKRARGLTAMKPNARVPGKDGAGSSHLAVVGASARAMSESAARAGWRVHAADLFADADLVRVAATAIGVRGAGPAGYPLGLPAVIAGFPPGPCIFTGGLENHPDVLAAIGADRPLCGSPLAAIRLVRDPAALTEMLAAAGIARPQTLASPAGVPTDGTFLLKPRDGAGGRGIAPWHGGRAPAGPAIWQRIVAGESWGVSCLAAAGTCRVLGVARQLVGQRWCRAHPFAYCGSVAVPPAEIPAAARDALETLGVVLARDAGLVGLFGVDVVVARSGRPHVIEVNPRPTASMELIERATGESLAAAHVAASGMRAAPPPRPDVQPRPGVWSKAVLFGPRRDSMAPTAGRIEGATAAWSAADGLPAVADIPAAGAILPAGGPLVTVFARGDSMAGALALLRRRVAFVRRLFADRPQPASRRGAS